MTSGLLRRNQLPSGSKASQSRKVINLLCNQMYSKTKKKFLKLSRPHRTGQMVVHNEVEHTCYTYVEQSVLETVQFASINKR